jgi:hypothetical protein
MDDETKAQFQLLREAQKEMKESVDKGSGKIEGKVDTLSLLFSDHKTDDAVNFKGMTDTLEHVRVDIDKRDKDTEKRKDNRVLVWVAIIGAIAAAIATLAVDSVRHTEIQGKLEQIRVEGKASKSP